MLGDCDIVTSAPVLNTCVCPVWANTNRGNGSKPGMMFTHLHQYLIPVYVQSGQALIEEMAVSQGWYSQCHTKYDCFDSNQIQIHIQIQMQIRIQIQTQIHTDTVTDTYKDRNRHIGRSRLIPPQTDITKGWQHNFIKAQEQYKLSFLYRHYFQYIERKCD